MSRKYVLAHVAAIYIIMIGVCNAAPPELGPVPTVIVKDVTTPGREPFQDFDITNTQSLIGDRRLDLEFENASGNPVPEGKRLVIQHASVSIRTNRPDNDARCFISTEKTVDQHPLIVSNPIRGEGPDGPTLFFIATEVVTLYVEAGDSPEIACIFADPIGPSIQSVVITGSVSGYFISTE